MDAKQSVSVVRLNLVPDGRLWEGEASSKSSILPFDSLKSLTFCLRFSFSRDSDNTPIKFHAQLAGSDTRQPNFNNNLVFALDNVDRGVPIWIIRAPCRLHLRCKIVPADWAEQYLFFSFLTKWGPLTQGPTHFLRYVSIHIDHYLPSKSIGLNPAKDCTLIGQK